MSFTNVVVGSSGGSGAPTDAHYVTTTAESGLSAESNLGALSTGILAIDVSAGTATPTNVTLTGTANQILVANGTGSGGNPTFSTPQDIATSSTPQFARLGLGTTAGSGNNLINLNTAGNIQVAGANAKKTIVLSGAGGWGSTTAGATGPTKTESTTNKVNTQTLDFADSGAKAYAEWAVFMPDNWDGSTITAKFIWTANSTSTNSVVWGLQARAYADAGTIDQAFGTAQEVTQANTSTALQVHISSATSAITVGGSPAGGQYVHFRCYRDSANASDTLAVTASLLAIQIKYGEAAYSA